MTRQPTPPAVKPAAGAPPKGHHWVELPVEEEELHVKLPRYGDGDEVTVLTRAGYVEQGTVDMSHGWCVRGEDDELIPLAAIAVRDHAGSAVKSRSGAHTNPRVIVSLDPGILARIDAHCEEGGITRSEWLREAARAYLILVDKDRLTDADWRRVVGG